MTQTPIRRRLGAICCALALLFTATAPAHAAMVGTDEVLGSAEVREQRAELVELVERDAVREQLIDQGVDPAAAQERIRHMTDAEIARLHGQIDELPAGGSVLGAVLVVFVVFVITDAIGATDIFPFIRPVN